MRAKKHLDPVYIFSKLKAEKAFEYVAQRKPLGPEDRFIKGFQFFYDDTFTVSKVRNVEKKFVDLLSNSGLIQGLSDVDAKYQRLLKKYSGKDFYSHVLVFSKNINLYYFFFCRNVAGSLPYLLFSCEIWMHSMFLK